MTPPPNNKKEEKKKGAPPISLGRAAGAGPEMYAWKGIGAGTKAGAAAAAKGAASTAVSLGLKVGLAVLISAVGAGGWFVSQNAANSNNGPGGLSMPKPVFVDRDAEARAAAAAAAAMKPYEGGHAVASSLPPAIPLAQPQSPEQGVAAAAADQAPPPDPGEGAENVGGLDGSAADAAAASQSTASQLAKMTPPAGGTSSSQASFGGASLLNAGASKLAGGSGLFGGSKIGGVGRGFKTGSLGRAHRMGRASTGNSRAASRGLRRNVSGRTAAAQLANVNAASRAASVRTGEASAAPASAGFDGTGATGTAPTTPGTALVGGIGGGSGGGSAGGSPAVTGPTNGWDNSGPILTEEQPGTTAPPVASHQNVTPWQGLLDMASMLLKVAGMILLACTAMVLLCKAFPKLAPFLYPAIKALATVALVMAGAATLMGLAIAAMGQTKQGLMITLMGGLATFGAYRLMALDETAGAQNQAGANQVNQAGAAEASNTTMSGSNLNQGPGHVFGDEVGQTWYQGPDGNMVQINTNTGVQMDPFGNTMAVETPNGTVTLDSAGNVPQAGQTFQAGGQTYVNTPNGAINQSYIDSQINAQADVGMADLAPKTQTAPVLDAGTPTGGQVPPAAGNTVVGGQPVQTVDLTGQPLGPTEPLTVETVSPTPTAPAEAVAPSPAPAAAPAPAPAPSPAAAPSGPPTLDGFSGDGLAHGLEQGTPLPNGGLPGGQTQPFVDDIGRYWQPDGNGGFTASDGSTFTTDGSGSVTSYTPGPAAAAPAPAPAPAAAQAAGPIQAPSTAPPQAPIEQWDARFVEPITQPAQGTMPPADASGIPPADGGPAPAVDAGASQPAPTVQAPDSALQRPIDGWSSAKTPGEQMNARWFESRFQGGKMYYNNGTLWGQPTDGPAINLTDIRANPQYAGGPPRLNYGGR